MLFRWLVTVLLVVQLGGVQLNTIAQSYPAKRNADSYLYLPYIAYDPPLQIIVLSTGFPPDRPGFTVSGYVLNRTQKPFYNVMLRVNLNDPGVSNSTQATSSKISGFASTAFPATLPGQPNSFLYIQRGGSRSIALESTEVYQALDKSPNVSTYVALNASDWISGNSMITGTVRNDTALSVQDALVYVIITGTTSCTTLPGVFLMTTTLQPGETTPYIAYGCDPMIPYPVAQGRVSP